VKRIPAGKKEHRFEMNCPLCPIHEQSGDARNFETEVKAQSQANRSAEPCRTMPRLVAIGLSVCPRNVNSSNSERDSNAERKVEYKGKIRSTSPAA
jgi:hypothetical protein